MMGYAPANVIALLMPQPLTRRSLQPIMDVTSNDLICNGGINPYHQPISTAIINVPAGSQVTAEWHHS